MQHISKPNSNLSLPKSLIQIGTADGCMLLEHWAKEMGEMSSNKDQTNSTSIICSKTTTNSTSIKKNISERT